MTTPFTSTGPTPPTGTSNPVSLRGWFASIIDWIKALSPAGATVYDTGWVTLSSGTVGVWARREGRTVTVSIDMSLTGMTDNVVHINSGAPLLPSDMLPPRQIFGAGLADQPGVRLHPAVVLVATNGALTIVKPPEATTGLSGTATYICG